LGQFNISLEPPFPPETKEIVQFLQLHFAEADDALAHLPPAIASSEILRRKLPDKAWVFHVSGALCCYAANLESGKRFFGEALLIDPDYQDARVALESALVSDPDWPSMETFLDALGKGVDTPVGTYLERAHDAFNQGDMMEADRLCQRVSALIHPQYSMLDSLETCMERARGLAEAGELEGAIGKIVEKLRRYWQHHDHEYREPGSGDDEETPLYEQLTAIVADLVVKSRTPPAKVFEIGCLNGFNLNAIRLEATRLAAPDPWVGGLEPNPSAIASGRRSYPDVEISEGFHSDMISGRVPIPDRLDICLVSLVFMILPPGEVRAVLDFLSERTRTLVICDDILNSHGDFTVIRSNQWLVHNFRELLAEAGFEIENIVLAEVPKREGTGFIIATNRQLS